MGGREFVALGEEEESILSKKGNKKKERVVVLCHPLSLSFVLSVEEDERREERRKKVGRKNHQLLSLLLQEEGNTTLLLLHVYLFVCLFVSTRSKTLKGKSNHNTTPKEAKLESPLSTIPPFSQERFGIIGVFFSQAISFCCCCCCCL